MSLLLLFLSLYIGINIRFSIVTGIVEFLVICSLIIFKLKNVKLALSCLLPLSLGVGLSFIRPSYYSPSYSGVVLETKENYFIFSSKLEKFYVAQKEHEYEIGDYLLITGEKKELDFISLESEF